MRTSAPGKFDCEVYLMAWQLEMRDDYVMRHIDNCPFCGTLVHGDGEDFPLSVEEEADIRIRARRRVRRRRFLKFSAAAVIGVAGVGLGLHSLLKTPSSLEDAVHRQFKSLEARFQATGSSGMHKYAKVCSEQDLVELVEWIGQWRKVELYDILVDGVSDRRGRVKMIVGAALIGVDPADLTPHLPQLRACYRSETDRDYKRFLRTIITAVENS